MILQESVELPLTHPEYYEDMGIKPPKGVILYGAPGTGESTVYVHVYSGTSLIWTPLGPFQLSTLWKCLDFRG